jgi:hypothetical protein
MMITILISAVVIFVIGLLCRNRWLEARREKLEAEKKYNERTINIQNRVTDVIQNTKPTNFDGNIKRMYDGEL